MNRLRLSYSLMSLWERGDVDGAVATYFHMDRPLTEAMSRGKNKHMEISTHIEKYRSFPDWFFQQKLVFPQPEKEVVVRYNDVFDLKCYIDCLDRSTRTMYEYKFSVSDSLTWARTKQVPLYFLIAELGNVRVDKAIVIRHTDNESDFCVVHNTNKARSEARNFVDSVGPEIYEHFVKEGLL